MTDDLAEVERIAGALIKSLGASDRRRILRAMARDLQRGQQARIRRQQNADGSAYEPRRDRAEPIRGGYAVRFLYPKGAAEPREVLMKSWNREGALLTGFDIRAGGVRSFFWDKVDRWLPVDPADRTKSGGRLRRNGHIRRRAMFRKLASGRNLRAGATDLEAWVGFAGRAAQVAGVHQGGLIDRPAPKARPIRYARRELLGVTERDRQGLLDLLLRQVAVATAP